MEPGIVEDPKIILSYVTGSGAGLYAIHLADKLIKDRLLGALLARTVATMALVFVLLPHDPVGISEVHRILGSTLFIIFGAVAAGLGYGAGVVSAGTLLRPFDLPEYA